MRTSAPSVALGARTRWSPLQKVPGSTPLRRAIPETVKNPDYLIERGVFDNYAPAEATSPRIISSSIATTVKSGQTSRIELNLDDSAVDLNTLRKQFDDYQIAGHDEVIVIRGGAVIPCFP